jgi:non-heme chloroperoxidase
MGVRRDTSGTLIFAFSHTILISFKLWIGAGAYYMPFYGFNRPGAKISQGIREGFWLQGMMCGFKAAYDCIKAFSETDFTEDLKKVDVPTLAIHGSDDQIVPINASARATIKLVPDAILKIYPDAPHGLAETQLNTDLEQFCRS